MDHLFLVSLGPVQDFIAQARRMRDLWFGSFLLSEISKAAARAIAEQPGAQLIFPALDRGDPALDPCDASLQDGQPAPNVANKILARVGGDPVAVAKAARAAARQRLGDFWNKVRAEHSALLDPAAAAAAEEQIDTLLEFHAVWADCPDDHAYAGVRESLDRELSARKALRDFSPWPAQRRGALKSSLDGARETVLRGQEPRAAVRKGSAWKRLRIGLREELDAVGLLKRAGGKPEQFVPVPSIGMAGWTERARQRCPEQLQALADECRKRELTRVTRRSAWVEAFPFDAQVYLRSRWGIYLDEQSGADRREALEFGRRFVEPLLKELGEPHPFVACLVADGDRMGDAINALAKEGAARHRDFSRGLSGFAAKARGIVEQEHRGVLVYAGGDDVLAFVAVPDALSCASRLREVFAQLMGEILGDRPGVPRPTLSVGIGIGHVLESLRDLLALGREAEREAKGDDRDALAVHLQKRGGQRLLWRERWPDRPVERLEGDIERLRSDRLPLTKVHEIGRLLEVLPPSPALLRGEIGRLLARAEPGGGARGIRLADVGLDLDGLEGAAAHQAIARWIDRQLIAAELLAAGERRESTEAAR